MNIDDLKKSSFLKRSDVAKQVLATITGGEKLNVAKEGAPEELKFCLNFAELEKPLVMNAINLEIVANITGSRDTDNWIGHKVVLYDDPNVSFGGKLTGGIRIRAPKQSYSPVRPMAQPQLGGKAEPAPIPGSMPFRAMAEAAIAGRPLPPSVPIPDEDVPY